MPEPVRQEPAANPTLGSVPADVAAFLVERQLSGVLVMNADGRITAHNPSALRVLEMTPEQLAGTSSLDPRWEAVDQYLQPMPGERHPAMIALATGQPVRGTTMGVRVGDGAYRWLRVDSWPLDDGGVVTQFKDITGELGAQARMADALDLLQRHALPGEHPASDWLSVRSRYQARPGALDVGGDFLDVFSVDDERLGFFIGDASGHDLATVTSMVTARHTLRAAGLHFHRPAQVLRWLDDILASTPSTVFCTAVYGTITPAADHGIDVVLGNAGHPPPVHVSANGASLVEPHGALLGAFDSFRDPPTVELHLAPGDRLVLFTNGLVDSCRPRLIHEELVELLIGSHDGGDVDPYEVLDLIVQRCIDEGGPDRDDMAYLVLTASGGTGSLG
jgi:hypothetical protein